MLCSDAIYVPCTVVAVEALLPRSTAQKRIVWVTLRIAISVLRLFVAVYVKDFVKMTNLTSAAFVTMNNILLPILAFYVAGPSEKAGHIRRLVHMLMFLVGACNMVFGTISSVQELFADVAHTVEADRFPRDGISAACKEAYRQVHSAQALVVS